MVLELSLPEVQTLLAIARRSVEAAVTRANVPGFQPPTTMTNLFKRAGAFVTLRNHQGTLRGCIGRLSADAMLYAVVREMAVAATRDPRFAQNPILPAELPLIFIEISILSPLERVSNPLEDIQPGVHGVYIKAGDRTGCFLPHVATEMGWSTEQLLNYCCTHKANLPADAWKAGVAEVYRFTSQVYKEPDLEIPPQVAGGGNVVYVQPT